MSCDFFGALGIVTLPSLILSWRQNRMFPTIQHNAARLRELRARIRETVRHRDESAEARAAWEAACADFHQQYDALAFPGGLEAGLEKIRQSDRVACETAMNYLERPPYCFRSQYVMNYLRRALNKAALRHDLAARFGLWKERQTERKVAARQKRLA
ncbi:hypothetical protein BH09VER1_BH09VER1_45630 [soil metagenome]